MAQPCWLLAACCSTDASVSHFPATMAVAWRHLGKRVLAVAGPRVSAHCRTFTALAKTRCLPQIHLAGQRRMLHCSGMWTYIGGTEATTVAGVLFKTLGFKMPDIGEGIFEVEIKKW